MNPKKKYYKDKPVSIKIQKSSESLEEAKRVAEEDPFIKEGAESYQIRTIELSCEENNHMGMG